MTDEEDSFVKRITNIVGYCLHSKLNANKYMEKVIELDKENGSTFIRELFFTNLKETFAKHEKAGNGFGFSLFGSKDVARTLSARYHKDGSEILIAQKGTRPRRLTPTECARLMGFEHGDRKWHIPVSDTQGYRQFGNAV